MTDITNIFDTPFIPHVIRTEVVPVEAIASGGVTPIAYAGQRPTTNALAKVPWWVWAAAGVALFMFLGRAGRRRSSW